MITREEFLSLGLDNDDSYRRFVDIPFKEIIVEYYDNRLGYEVILHAQPHRPQWQYRVGNFATREEAERVALTLRLSR